LHRLAHEGDRLVGPFDGQQGVDLLALLLRDLERAELRELGNELLVVHRLQRILELQLREQYLQEVLLVDATAVETAAVLVAGSPIASTAMFRSLLFVALRHNRQIVERLELLTQRRIELSAARRSRSLRVADSRSKFPTTDRCALSAAPSAFSSTCLR